MVFGLSGHLDSMQADYLYTVLKKRTLRGQERWILDLGEVEFISSMGMGMLVRLNSRLRKAGGEVKIARAHGIVADALRITHLDRVMQMYPSVDEAAASWSD